MAPRSETAAPAEGHEPTALVHGPVASRRFGRSLGVSCSWPGVRACAWRCPYCQLGHLPDVATALAPVDAIVAAAAAALNRHAGAIDALTIAGGGEPLDHPEAPRLVAGIAMLAARHRVALHLLTNGDRLDQPDLRAALGARVRVWVKHDPGPVGGSWGPQRAHADRVQRLARWRPLRIQAMLFRRHGVNGDPARLRDAWLAELRRLRPVEVHLTTIERRPADPRLRALGAAELADWRAAVAAELGVPVAAFGARGPLAGS